MIRHNYDYLLEYIPARYTGLSQKQLKDRTTVYDFKDGIISNSVRNEFLSRIRGIISETPSNWAVCFIPASSRNKTYNRYSALALFLSREAGCDVYIDAIIKTTDSEAGHIIGKNNNPTEDFNVKSEYLCGKRVILIDDVITRGRTFDDTADLIMKNGSISVQGLFLSKTIHPNLPQINNGNNSHVSYFSNENDFEDEFYDDVYLNDYFGEESDEPEYTMELTADEPDFEEEYYL